MYPELKLPGFLETKMIESGTLRTRSSNCQYFWETKNDRKWDFMHPKLNFSKRSKAKMIENGALCTKSSNFKGVQGQKRLKDSSCAPELKFSGRLKTKMIEKKGPANRSSDSSNTKTNESGVLCTHGRFFKTPKIQFEY